MVKREHLWTFHKAGIQVDMFGRKIKKGDTVLTKGYYSADKNCFATVKRVNKKSIVVDVENTYWSWGEHRQRPVGHQGYWDYYPNKKRITEIKEMRRQGPDTLIVPHDFYEIAAKQGEDAVNEHPELFI